MRGSEETRRTYATEYGGSNGFTTSAGELVGNESMALCAPRARDVRGGIQHEVPMAAWMRFRGMAFRPILEMSAAMVAEAIIILIAYWFGAVENVAAGRATTLWAWQHGLMVPAMLVPMFMRLDM